MSTSGRRMVVALACLLVAGGALVKLTPARAEVSAGDCSWVAKADPDAANIAYPDQGAGYWLATFALPQGTGLEIRGQYPLARYMSFHVYEGSIPVDGLPDVQIAPSTGTNPFQAHAVRSRRGTYVVKVDGTHTAPSDPAQRAPNTLYAGYGLNGEPMVTGTILYRVYLGDRDEQGSAPLPNLVYTNLATGAAIDPTTDCSRLRSPLPPTGANQAVEQTSEPADPPARVSATPSWSVARSRPSRTSAGPASVTTGNPFFANFDNVYLKATVWRDAGQVVVVRARAPTFPDTRGATVMGTGQVRYWSFCTNESATTRYVGCVADEKAALDSAGYVTVVISDAAHKPATLAPSDNWLAWGPYPDTFLIYRQMLPDPSYGQAIADVTQDTNEANIAATMGSYYPVLTACSSADFDRNRCGAPV